MTAPGLASRLGAAIGATMGFLASQWRCLPRVAALLTVVEDLRRRQSRVEEANRWLLLGEQMAGIGHWRLELPSRALTWSDQIFRIYGLKKNETALTLDLALAAYHPDDKERVALDLATALQAGTCFENQARVIRPSGETRHVWSRGVVQADAKRRPTVLFGVVIDITEHKRAEARQAAEHDRQAQSRRLEALGQLAGGVAHDINNVLQTISAASGMIEARADQSSEVVRLGLLIGKATERAAAIVGRLLVFAHCSPLRAEAIDPAAMLRSLPDLLDQVPGSAIEIRLDLPADLPLVSADAAQLEAVMVNLVGNARDAVQAGGVITLSARPAQCGDGEAPHADLLPGRYVSLSITDQGAGMSEATLERAIEPFFTTKPRGRGTGLGLSMAAGFAKQSGGALSLSSRKGLGTCVTLWLPEADAAALAALARRPVEGERRAHAGKTILLVDDESDLRTLLAEELVERGYTVIQKEDGLAARIWIEQREPVDLLVTDLSMPELDGVSLIQAAQAVHPDLPAILLTGHALDIGRFAPHRATGCHYTLLSKPIRAGALVASIARLLDAKGQPGAADAQEELQDDQRVSAAI